MEKEEQKEVDKAIAASKALAEKEKAERFLPVESKKCISGFMKEKSRRVLH